AVRTAGGGERDLGLHRDRRTRVRRARRHGRRPHRRTPARRIRQHPRAAPADAEHRARRGSGEEGTVGDPRRRIWRTRGDAFPPAGQAAVGTQAGLASPTGFNVGHTGAKDAGLAGPSKIKSSRLPPLLQTLLIYLRTGAAAAAAGTTGFLSSASAAAIGASPSSTSPALLPATSSSPRRCPGSNASA